MNLRKNYQSIKINRCEKPSYFVKKSGVKKRIDDFFFNDFLNVLKNHLYYFFVEVHAFVTSNSILHFDLMLLGSFSSLRLEIGINVRKQSKMLWCWHYFSGCAIRISVFVAINLVKA